jgi:hypothetical protein
MCVMPARYGRLGGGATPSGGFLQGYHWPETQRSTRRHPDLHHSYRSCLHMHVSLTTALVAVLCEGKEKSGDANNSDLTLFSWAGGVSYM